MNQIKSKRSNRRKNSIKSKASSIRVAKNSPVKNVNKASGKKASKVKSSPKKSVNKTPVKLSTSKKAKIVTSNKKNKVENKTKTTSPLKQVLNSASKLRKESGSTIDLTKENKVECKTKINCHLCKKPVEIKQSEASWKTLCPPCFLKIRGKVVRCDACKIEFLSLGERVDGNFCYDCTLGIRQGVKSSCVKCNKIFYKHCNSHVKNLIVTSAIYRKLELKVNVPLVKLKFG